MHPALAEQFWAKVKKRGPDECWEWLGRLNQTGYGGHGRKFLAHRISWLLSNGSDAGHLCVLHRCDNPRCVNPAHLFLGTRADNIADMDAKGRRNMPRGEAHSFAKLTFAQVNEIREAPGLHREIAARFGINRSNVSHIKTGRTWSGRAAPK